MRKLMILVTITALLLGSAALVRPDDRERERHGQKILEEQGRRAGQGWTADDESVPPVDDTTYADTCGACHFAYQPALLPARSWQALLDNCADHFGESLDLAPDELDALSDYLTANAADVSGSEIGEKITDCLNGATPLRITDVPIFQRKHRRIKTDVLRRESVGGLQNCPACHSGAEQGEYEHPRIPK
ncbi:MAG: diheme cytochrome c [Desulfovibrio sp.]